VAAYTGAGARVWRAGQEQALALGGPTAVIVSLVIAPPCAILVAAGELRVVELETQRTVREVELGAGYSAIKASSKAHLGIWRRGGIDVFEKAELLDTNIPNDQLWRRRIEPPSILLGLNTTSIFHCDDDGKLGVQDFWLQREQGEELAGEAAGTEEREQES
jgi:hypothetical protein